MKITKGAKSIAILEPVEYTRADGSPGISYNVKKVFEIMREKKIPLFALESQEPVKNFDFLGITLQYRVSVPIVILFFIAN